MTKATLRTTATDTQLQQAAATAAPVQQIARPAAVAPRPAVVAAILPRGGAPALVAPAPGQVTGQVTGQVAAAAAPRTLATIASASARVAAPARPVAAPARPVAAPARPVAVAPRPATVAAPVAPAAPAVPVRPLARPVAKPAPIIEVATEVVQTETPVADVFVDSVNTHAKNVEETLFKDAAAPAPAEHGYQNEGDLAPVQEAPAEVVQEAEVVDQVPENPEDAAPAAQAVIVRPPAALARAGFSDGKGLQGDWGQEDLKYPRLAIVRGSGALSQQFNDGTLIYADLPLLPPPNVAPNAQNPALYFVPLVIKKGWRENLDKVAQDAGEMPRNASTVDEVEAMGGTTQWIANVKPTWSPSAMCILLIEKPEGSDHPSFVVPCDGRDYAVAIFYVSGGDFNAFAKVIYNTAKTTLQVPVTDAAGNAIMDGAGRVQKTTMLYKNYWTMQYAKVTRGQFQVWAPSVRLLAKEATGPDVRAYIEQLGLDSGNEVHTQAE